MIGSLSGVVDQILPPSVLIVDVAGVGYLVHCPTDLISRVRVGEKTKLVIFTSVREDAITLYGFESVGDKVWFEALKSAQGVGPALALNILSSMSRSELAEAIANKDHALLTKVPGVGPKTASRLIVELQGKLTQLGISGLSIDSLGRGAASVVGDVRLALSSLGYPQDQIRAVLENVPMGLSLEEMLRFCLKELSG